MNDSLKKFLKAVLVIDVIGFVAAMLVKRFVPDVGDSSTERFRVVCVTDGRQWMSTCSGLIRGGVVTVMGGVQLDLTEARPSPDGFHLELMTVMGGVEVRVPDDWTVHLDGLAVMGGHDAGRKVENGPDLVIHCTTVMGGVQVKQLERSAPVGPTSSGE